ncbi:MAG: cob(I)yrinic acid a,c-diamide adenosyltransferase [Desulfobacteraceae bacterium]|nr:MAG: cob(I)yrinic acid a,c-diamide adenosyltransferase [Desulfobacteraceae bacterium]
MPSQGLIMIHTGDGKGKTTAAMGLALRAAGHQLKCLMIQFIKGSWAYGELEAIKKLQPYFEIIPMGKGFIRFDQGGPTPEDIQAVRETWDFFMAQMQSGRYDLIILDEINYVLDYRLLPVQEVVDALKNKPARLHLILTGRNAKPEIVELADLVTEMKEIKHPYRKGIRAQKGIEF